MLICGGTFAKALECCFMLILTCGQKTNAGQLGHSDRTLSLTKPHLHLTAYVHCAEYTRKRALHYSRYE